MKTPITILRNEKLRRLQVICLVGLMIWTLVALVGCSTTKELERVAKDWCMTIRASQVIPVYPLTEDIQPGDVFLVQTPIEEQIGLYKSRGFLPLDNHLVRLQLNNYHNFYSRRYGIENENTMPPGIWQFPNTQPQTANYANAPRSAFPSYNFTVSRSEGFKIALPIHGIPVGLNLLNSAKAHGSITIADSYTYGTDVHELDTLVRDWADENKVFLAQFVPVNEASYEGIFTNLINSITGKNKQKRYYLRVTNRVYLTGRVNISVFNDEALGATASGGIPEPFSLPKSDSQINPIDNINELLDKNLSVDTLSTPAEPSAVKVGGTLKVAMASSRSITLVETFPRPLVVGYIAFDLPILKDGKLGAPVSTQLLLTGKRVSTGPPISYEKDENTEKIRAWLRKKGEGNRERLKEWLKEEGTQKWLNGHSYSKVISGEHTISDILTGENYGPLRAKIVEDFKIE